LGTACRNKLKGDGGAILFFFFAFAKQPVAQGFKLQKNSFTLLFLFDTCALYPLQISFVFSTLAI
jgi:hypothetical protein